MQPQDPGQAADRMALEIETRRQEVQTEVTKELTRIIQKDHINLTVPEKAFLQARQSYISKSLREEYKDELSEDLTLVNLPLEEMTRSQLDEKAIAVGVENPDKMKSKQEVIDAIKELQ